MNNLKLKRCEKCGSIVLELKECECDECLTCCGVSMKEINASNEEVNKHIPSYYRQDNKLIIRVNHEQEENHYIEAIIIKTENEVLVHKFTSEEEPELIMGYEPNMEIYSLCTKDGLFKVDVI